METDSEPNKGGASVVGQPAPVQKLSGEDIGITPLIDADQIERAKLEIQRKQLIDEIFAVEVRNWRQVQEIDKKIAVYSGGKRCKHCGGRL